MVAKKVSKIQPKAFVVSYRVTVAHDSSDLGMHFSWSLTDLGMHTNKVILDWAFAGKHDRNQPGPSVCVVNFLVRKGKAVEDLEGFLMGEQEYGKFLEVERLSEPEEVDVPSRYREGDHRF